MNSVNRVLEFIIQNNLISRGDRIVCGLSGGADSCAMLHILHTLSDSLGFSVVGAHLNHMIRGDEAIRDETFAGNFCDSLGIPFYVRRVDVTALASSLKLSLEDAGRKARYGFFEELCRELSANKIATAHNKNDNAETVLMHAIRGTGNSGLCGIPPVRGNIIRPVLALSGEELRRYCKEKNIDYVTDSSNLENDYTRNKIRNRIFPLLEEINPRVTDALCRLAKTAAINESFFEKCIENIPVKGGKVALDDIRTLDAALLPTLLEKMAKQKNISLSLSEKNVCAVFELIHSESGGTRFADLGAKVRAVKSYDDFYITNEQKPVPFEYVLTEQGKIKINRTEIYLSPSAEDGAVCLPVPSGVKVTVRSRRSGDKMKINGMSRKLQDLFVNKKIPLELRDTLIIIDFDGEPVCVCGVAADDRLGTVKAKKYIIIKTEV